MCVLIIFYDILMDTHVVFLLEIYLNSFCRGRMNIFLFTIPLEWSGKNKIQVFYLLFHMLGKKCLFTLPEWPGK